MNTIIEQRELDSELQELHLLSTTWISEVQFLTVEINFLKRLSNQRSKQGRVDQDAEKARDISARMNKLENSINTVQAAVKEHIKYLEQLILNPLQQFDLSIIDNHAALERNITEDSILIKACKKDLFSLSVKR